MTNFYHRLISSGNLNMLIFGLILIEVKVVFTMNGLYFLLSRVNTSADQTGRIITF